MNCKDLMTKYLKMCREECTVKDAAQIMKDLNVGAVPVINDNNEPVGIITDRDIMLNTLTKHMDPQKTPITEIMSKPVIICKEYDDINVAIDKMKKHKIRRIPVVNDYNKLVGIISLGDIAVLSREEHETFEALEEISQPVSSAK